jgi:hypothetical protein
VGQKNIFCVFHTFRWSSTYLCYILFENAKKVKNRLTLLGSRGTIFDFWIFDLLQMNLGWQKNSQTKVEKAFFFIFMSSYAEMNFWGQKS